MRFRFGLAVGFGAGYYLGAKAGRERYLELRRWVDKVKDSSAVEAAAEKAQALVDLGVERAKDLVGHEGEDRGPNGAEPATTAPPTTSL